MQISLSIPNHLIQYILREARRDSKSIGTRINVSATASRMIAEHKRRNNKERQR